MAGIGTAVVRGAAGAGAGVTAARAASSIKGSGGKGSATITASFLVAGLLLIGAAWTGKSPAKLVQEIISGAGTAGAGKQQKKAGG